MHDKFFLLLGIILLEFLIFRYKCHKQIKYCQMSSLKCDAMKSLNMCLNHSVCIHMNKIVYIIYIRIRVNNFYIFFDMKSAKERRQKQLCLCWIDKPESNISINQSLSRKAIVNCFSITRSFVASYYSNIPQRNIII